MIDKKIKKPELQLENCELLLKGLGENSESFSKISSYCNNVNNSRGVKYSEESHVYESFTSPIDPVLDEPILELEDCDLLLQVFDKNTPEYKAVKFMCSVTNEQKKINHLKNLESYVHNSTIDPSLEPTLKVLECEPYLSNLDRTSYRREIMENSCNSINRHYDLLYLKNQEAYLSSASSTSPLPIKVEPVLKVENCDAFLKHLDLGSAHHQAVSTLCDSVNRSHELHYLKNTEAYLSTYHKISKASLKPRLKQDNCEEFLQYLEKGSERYKEVDALCKASNKTKELQYYTDLEAHNSYLNTQSYLTRIADYLDLTTIRFAFERETSATYITIPPEFFLFVLGVGSLCLGRFLYLKLKKGRRRAKQQFKNFEEKIND
jgi:hypothetical protein